MSKSSNNPFNLLDQISIGVIGDVMLDCFVYGEVSRISPEAPSAVLTFEREVTMLGGAGNVAAGVHALGAAVDLVGVVGDDAAGEEVRRILKKHSMKGQGLITSRGKITTKKTRYVSKNHHILRVDHEESQPLATSSRRALMRFLEKKISTWSVMVLADYNKGVFNKDLVGWLLQQAQKYSIPTIVDAKPRMLLQYVGATLVTPNLKEARDITGKDEPDAAALILQKKLKSSVLITLGERGMLLRAGASVRSYPALAKGVIDVSGAGDTVVATTAVAFACGNTLNDAIDIANHAAGIAVQKPGTSIVTSEELKEAIFYQKNHSTHTKIYTLRSLERIIKKHRSAGDRVVFTNGVFDLLHEGHISILETSKRHGDVLIVGVNADASVRRLKGSNRPTLPLKTRMRMLAALSAVSYVVSFSEDTPIHLIKKLKPDVLVKGGDYVEETIVGASFVKSYGGKVVIVSTVDGKSTTNLLHKIRNTH